MGFDAVEEALGKPRHPGTTSSALPLWVRTREHVGATPDTAKGLPLDYRASSRPYRITGDVVRYPTTCARSGLKLTMPEALRYRASPPRGL